MAVNRYPEPGLVLGLKLRPWWLGRSGFYSCLCDRLPMRPEAGHFLLLYLQFPTCKLGILMNEHRGVEGRVLFLGSCFVPQWLSVDQGHREAVILAQPHAANSTERDFTTMLTRTLLMWWSYTKYYFGWQELDMDQDPVGSGTVQTQN